MADITQGYAYSNGGFSLRAFDPSAPPLDGEVVFPDIATPERLDAVFPGYLARIAIDSANEVILAQIDALENSITNRMWRESAVGSVATMNFGSDDPRTGKTASQYIVWVDGKISELRARLEK